MDWNILVNQGSHERSRRDALSRHLVFTKKDEEPGCYGELCVSVHPMAIWRIWCRSAMVLSPRTSRRRQIIGLMPNRATLSW